MKKIFPFHAILFALYPVITLYANLPGGVIPNTTTRSFIFQIAIACIMLAFFYLMHRDLLRAGFITGITVFYFSSTGHVYRVLQQGNIPAWAHLVIVLIGVFMFIVLNQPLVWEKYLTPVRLAPLTNYLNLIAIFSLIYPSYEILSTAVKNGDDEPIPWTEVIKQDITPQKFESSTLPDIYYIILDGYGRQDALLDLFGYDNSDFSKSLQSRGFYIAENSRSNYIRTVASLSSSLNMNYINFAQDRAGWDSVNYVPLFNLIQHGYVRTTLEGLGYKTVAVSIPYWYTNIKDADVYFYPYRVEINEFESTLLSTSALGAFFDMEFSFTGKIRNFLPLPNYNTHREQINFAYKQLAEIPSIPGPKFIFIHIVAPHPPFVFDKNGNPTQPNRPYGIGDGENFAGSYAEYKTGYTDQIQYINKATLNAIDNILANSSADPVIILQGDHGSGSHLDPNSIKASCMYERTSILNAYHMPEGKTQLLYPAITPVNSFRVVFNTYFGTDFPMLPDLTYYSPWVNPYNFVDVTDHIETTCK